VSLSRLGRVPKFLASDRSHIGVATPSLTLKPVSGYNDVIPKSGNLATIGMEVEGAFRKALSRMSHPVRTLLNEIFVLPPKRTILRLYEVCIRTTRFIAAVVIHLRRHLKLPHPAMP
jgi:hypothetical protein